MNIELTKQEIEAILNLLNQLQIRPVSADAVEATIMYYNLNRKLSEALNGPSDMPMVVAGTPGQENV